MKLTRWFLSAALTFSLTVGAASALTLKPAQVYAVPGADAVAAVALPGNLWAITADNAVMIVDQSLKVQRAWHDLFTSVERLVVSPDGSRLAAMTDTHWMAWEVQTGRVLGQGRVYSNNIGFDADGNLLVMYRGALLRNSLESGPERFTALDVGQGWYEFSVSPDGKTVVLSDDLGLQWVRLEDGEVIAETEFREEPDGVSVTFSPDGQGVVVRTGYESLILSAGGDVTEIEFGDELSLDGSVFYLNDQEFVYAEDGEALRFDASTGAARGDWREVNLRGSVVRGPQGQFLALGRGVAQFDPQSLSERGRVDLPSGNTWWGAFLPNGTALAGVTNFRDVKTGKIVQVGPNERMFDFDDAAGLVWTLSGLKVNVYQDGKVRTLATLDEDGEYDQLLSSPDGRFAVASGYYGAALLSASTGKLVKTVTEKDLKGEELRTALPTPDGKGILLVPYGGEVMRFDVATGKQTPALALADGQEATILRFTPSGTLAAAFVDDDYNRGVALVKPGATKPFKTMPVEGRIQNLKFSPDGKLLAVLTSEKTNAVNVFDTATGTLLTRTGQFNTTTSLLAWSTDGKQLMVGSGLIGKAGSVTIFDVQR